MRISLSRKFFSSNGRFRNSLIKTLLSRNFRQNSVRVNFCNFHTVRILEDERTTREKKFREYVTAIHGCNKNKSENYEGKKDYFSIPFLEEAVAKLISYVCMMQKPIEFILHLFRE